MKQLGCTLKALLSHYWRHPWQALFLVAGLTAGVALWSAVQIINGHAQASYEKADSLLGVQQVYTLYPKQGAGVPQAEYIRLRRAGWTQLYPVIDTRVETQTGKLVAIIASDLFALPSSSGRSGLDIAGDNQAWLNFIQAPYQAWYPPALASELGVQQGQSLALKNGSRLPPALIQDNDAQGWQVLMDIGAAQALLSRTTLDYIAVGELSEKDVERLIAELPESLILRKNQQALDLTQLTDSLHTNLSAMSLLSFAVGLFIVFNAVRFSLWHRQLTVKNLRLMGVDLKTLGIALFIEALLWSVFAVAIGLLMGYAISLQLLPTLGSTLESLYGATMRAVLLFSLSDILIAWSMTLLGLLFALTWPMWQLSQQAIIPGSQLGAQWQKDATARRQLLLAGMVLALLAVIIYPFINSVMSGFVLLGLILFAAAWCLPWLLAKGLSGLFHFIPKQHLLLRWMMSDGWAQLPTLRTAMMALLLALTCNLGVETLIGSFRTSFTGWLTQRLTADIYVREHRPEMVKIIQQGQQQGWLKDTHKRQEVTVRWQQRPTSVRGLKLDAPDTNTLPMASSINEGMQQWRTDDTQTPWILANEQVQYLAGVTLGETVTLATEKGDQRFKIAGFFYDYGNANFQFYLSTQQLLNYWPNAKQYGVAFWLNPSYAGGETEAMTKAEQSLLSHGFTAGDWMIQTRIRSLALGIFEQTFAITLVMNTLTLLVAGLALLTSLMAILQERLPQFAQWSALGVKKREQVLIILIPLLLFVAITWLLSIPLGTLLSWLLIHKLNIMSFGWSMPMLWSIQPALVLAALSLVLVLVSVLVTGLRLRSRLPKALAQLGSAA